MKKNKILRLASVMLMLCLITTCAISGTFAKYTTAKTAADSAKVAKWGLTINLTNGEELFKTEYDNAIGTATNTVVSADSDEVIAPGTDGILSNISITGTPEVAFKLKVQVNLALTGYKFTADWDNNPSTDDSEVEYCPIVFTVKDTEYKINGTTITTVAELETAVEEAICDAIFGSKTTTAGTYSGGVEESFDYYPGDDAKEFANVTAFDVEWDWAYVGDDIKDTVLGNAETDPEIAFTLVIDATQID